jgi:hypothetical protein
VHGPTSAARRTTTDGQKLPACNLSHSSLEFIVIIPSPKLPFPDPNSFPARRTRNQDTPADFLLIHRPVEHHPSTFPLLDASDRRTSRNSTSYPHPHPLFASQPHTSSQWYASTIKLSRSCLHNWHGDNTAGLDLPTHASSQPYRPRHRSRGGRTLSSPRRSRRAWASRRTRSRSAPRTSPSRPSRPSGLVRFSRVPIFFAVDRQMMGVWFK